MSVEIARGHASRAAHSGPPAPRAAATRGASRPPCPPPKPAPLSRDAAGRDRVVAASKVRLHRRNGVVLIASAAGKASPPWILRWQEPDNPLSRRAVKVPAAARP